jgi:hypothetical protein
MGAGAPVGLGCSLPLSSGLSPYPRLSPRCLVLFRAQGGTAGLAGCPSNLTVLPRPLTRFRPEPCETRRKPFSGRLFLAMRDWFRQAYDYWQDQPGNHQRARMAVPCGPAHAVVFRLGDRVEWFSRFGGPTRTRTGVHRSGRPRCLESPLSLLLGKTNDSEGAAHRLSQQQSSRRQCRHANHRNDSTHERGVGPAFWLWMQATFTHRVSVQVFHQLPTTDEQRRPRRSEELRIAERFVS